MTVSSSAMAAFGPEDSPAQYCADFAALLDERKVSLRGAAARSGWGKTTIASARNGPDLPNVNLVVDVLEAIGEPAQTRQRWQERHERLSELATDVPAPTKERLAPPIAETAVHPEQIVTRDEPERDREDDPEVQVAVPTRRSHRWLIGGLAVVIAVVASGLTWWLAARSEGATVRTIVVQNKVAFGPSALTEDDTPSYLASRPISRCANVPGCKLEGTDLASGDTVDAVCQLQAATLTNADVQSTGVENNPNAAASSLWYGIRWRDGRRGYLSEVYVAPMYRGGLQLPPC